MSEATQEAAGPKKGLYPALALIESRKDVLSAMIPKTLQAVLGWERIRQNVGLVMAASEALQKAKPATIYAAVMNATALGLDLDPRLGQAYLVPYKGECQLIVGAQGKIELAYRSGMIEKIVCQAVFENDEFVFDLANGDVEHKVTKDQLKSWSTPGGRGALLGGYARVWVKGAGAPILELMDMATFAKIRASSKAPNSPAYANWSDEMLRRSVLNRALKRCPKSPDLMKALFEHTDLDTDTDVDTSAGSADLAGALSDLPSLPDHGEADITPEQVEAQLAKMKEAEKVETVKPRTKKADKADVIDAGPPKFTKPDIIPSDEPDEGEMP